MSANRDFENQLRTRLRKATSRVHASEALDRRVRAAIEAAPEGDGGARRLPYARRPILATPSFRSAALGTAAAILVLAVVVLCRTTVPSYAVTETLKAMQDIRTVHFRATLVRQGGPMECWMQLDPGVSRPTRMCLRAPSHPVRKIDGPDGSFAYNEETRRFRPVRRDERDRDWYLDFPRFFEEALGRAEQDKNVEVGQEIDADNGAAWITVTFHEPMRDWRVLVDPETRLPQRVETLSVRDWMGLVRSKPIVVESIDLIEYNLPMPEALFTIPDDAEQVVEEVDLIVHRGLGMAVGRRSHEEACRVLLEEVVAAMQAMDWDRVKQLYLPFMAPPPELQEQMKKVVETTGRPLIELVEVGEPYRDGAYWFVPNKAREADGAVKDDPVRIRFYSLNGEDFCIIAMPNL